MTEDYGYAILQRLGDGPVVVVQADECICVSRKLLAEADRSYLRVDGDRLSLCETHFYVATGETNQQGDPIYRRVMNEGDL